MLAIIHEYLKPPSPMLTIFLLLIGDKFFQEFSNKNHLVEAFNPTAVVLTGGYYYGGLLILISNTVLLSWKIWMNFVGKLKKVCYSG